ncbi:MAG: DUF1284 domain-containing protein [Roseitalea sp.]|nr:DUF1284 domain-containing protein [Roseitalea sp.]MBO6721616.1 DUF1284 domain-containing protein [Roseitalea sp.]MBO6743372.1 DUF1284 domain-containing protein [Roseitalea sp.]
MIEIRGHHLLCAVTFTGRGYSRRFERDFRRVVARMNDNEEMVIVAGPDAICASVKDCAGSHCHEERIVARDRAALAEISALTGRVLDVGSRLMPHDLFNARHRKAFDDGTIRAACTDCQWADLCDRIAEDGFHAALLDTR